jgi:hypothetical protein
MAGAHDQSVHNHFNSKIQTVINVHISLLLREENVVKNVCSHSDIFQIYIL